MAADGTAAGFRSTSEESPAARVIVSDVPRGSRATAAHTRLDRRALSGQTQSALEQGGVGALGFLAAGKLPYAPQLPPEYAWTRNLRVSTPGPGRTVAFTLEAT